MVEAIEDLPTRKTVTVDGVQKKHSHYVWFLNTGYWPDFKNKQEVIHHIDGDHQNNDFSNLQLMVNTTHLELHNPSRGGCIVDKMINKWGPYRYLVTRRKGKQTWKYLGRTDQFKVGKSVDAIGKPMEGK